MDNDKSIKTLTRSKLRPFRYHPYKVKEDEDMANLVNSIKEEGVISPIIVRKVGKDLEKINEKYRDGGSTQTGASSYVVVNLDFGQDAAHNNMQPYLAQNYIIKY